MPSFVDYLRSGWRIAFTCAIDYTASNGPHHDPRSLHFIGPYPNQYEQAIRNVGQVLEPYDSEGGFSVYGFGGIPRHIGQMQVNHCFPLTGNYQMPKIFGIQNVTKTYHETLPYIDLSGPTYFAPML